MEIMNVKSDEINELTAKMQEEGDRLRRVGQKLIDAADALQLVVFQYGHFEDPPNEKISGLVHSLQK